MTHLSGRTALGIPYPIVGIDQYDPGDALRQIVEAVTLAVHPVNSIFITLDDRNPGEYLGGTWEAFAAGRALVGVGGIYEAAQMTFGYNTIAARNTGDHVLTAAQSGLPAHVHTINHGHTGSTNSAGAHHHGIPTGSGGGSTHFSRRPSDIATGHQQPDVATTSAGSHSHTVTINNHSGNSGHNTAANATQGHSHTIAAQDNRMPLITVHMWRRTT